jgi:hypothetical protein
MTRQMADDEVLRVLDVACELHATGAYGDSWEVGLERIADVRAAVAALQAERDAKTAQLAQCFRLSGADPDGNEDWRIATDAVRAVTDLRRDSDAFRAMVRDAAIGRAYGRWYGAARGYTGVIADAAHEAILRDAFSGEAEEENS